MKSLFNKQDLNEYASFESENICDQTDKQKKEKLRDKKKIQYLSLIHPFFYIASNVSRGLLFDKIILPCSSISPSTKRDQDV